MKNAKGATYLEMTIALIVFLFLISSLIEFSRYFYLRSVLQSAAQKSLSKASWIPDLELDDSDPKFLAAKDSIIKESRNFAKNNAGVEIPDSSTVMNSAANDIRQAQNPIVIGLPEIDGSRTNAYSSYPLGIRLNTDYKAIFPWFFTMNKIHVEAWGYREPYTRSLKPQFLACDGKPFDPANPPDASDCPVCINGIGENGECCQDPWVGGTDPYTGKPKCVCDKSKASLTPSCTSNPSFVVNATTCTCDPNIPTNRCYGGERLDDGVTCGCKQYNQNPANAPVGCTVAGCTTGSDGRPVCHSNSCGAQNCPGNTIYDQAGCYCRCNSQSFTIADHSDPQCPCIAGYARPKDANGVEIPKSACLCENITFPPGLTPPTGATADQQRDYCNSRFGMIAAGCNCQCLGNDASAYDPARGGCYCYDPVNGEDVPADRDFSQGWVGNCCPRCNNANGERAIRDYDHQCKCRCPQDNYAHPASYYGGVCPVLQTGEGNT